jgi:DtxR family Mn-dependent transcriptional regulator
VSELIDTTEMYLKSILELEEEGLLPMRARIGERLGQSGPTVSQTVARMERDGLLTLQDDKSLVFTEYGRERAVGVMRKHRLAERLLVDVIGLDWQDAHDEACRWEHVMSEEVERKIAALVSTLDASPYGLAIPGLEELGLQSNEIGLGTPASELSDGDYLLTQIGEPLQVDKELLMQLSELGLIPGAKVKLEDQGVDKFLISQQQDEGLLVESDISRHIFLSSGV